MRGTLSRRIVRWAKHCMVESWIMYLFSSRSWSRPATFMARVLESESSTDLISQSETQNERTIGEGASWELINPKREANIRHYQ